MEFNLRNAQLFLDDAIIEQTQRLQRVVHQPHKYHGNPVYTVGAPWEGSGIVYLGGVYIDPKDGVWKAWYVTLNPPEYPEIVFAVCMIVSDDGFTWRRPELDVFRGHGGEWTNIVLDLGKAGRTAAPTILYEAENEPEPWTMIISLCWPAESTHYKGYFLRSADGVHWRWLRERPHGIEHGFHDRTTAMKGPDLTFPYVLIGRGKEDIARWGLDRAAHRLAVNTERAEEGEPTRVVVADVEDDPAMQVYHAYGFPYEGTYVGMFQHYIETDDPYGEMELIASRNTVNWQRIRPRQVFLPRSLGGGSLGAFDSHITDTALSPPVRTSRTAMPTPWGGFETLWFYYWGGSAMHGNRHLTFGRALGLAQLRADGFCSLRAERFPGRLVTKPFIWPGGRLLLNASSLGGGGNGMLRTEVLSSGLTPVPGMKWEDADGALNDGTSMEQTWEGDGARIERLQGEKIRLKFYVERYDLFSFRASG